MSDCPPHLAPKLQHVSEAKVKSWAFLEEPRLDDEIREIIAELAEDPLSVSQSRRDVIAKWAKRAQELEPARDLFSGDRRAPLRHSPLRGQWKGLR